MNSPHRGTPDFVLFLLTLGLAGFGLLMVFSASSMSNAYHYEDALYFTRRQAAAFVLGLAGLLFFMNIHITRLKKWAKPLFIVVLVMLFLVPIIGQNVNGARSWFKLGPLNLQPAEFAKLGIILYLASLISKKQEKIRDLKNGLVPALLVVGFVSFLIMLQPDFGSTMVLVLIAALVIVVGGANLKHIFLLGLVGGASAALVVVFKVLTDPSFTSGYQVARITAFLDPWQDERGAGYHIANSLYALGHGGWSGAGFGQSIQKLHYLPAPHNDFIFSIIGEELGFIGATLFLITYLLFLWRGILVSLRCEDSFGTLVGIGVIGMIGIQALINLGGVTNTIPLTGVTLPLISYGGSSMLVTLSSIGIVLGLSREQSKAAAAAEEPVKNKARLRTV